MIQLIALLLTTSPTMVPGYNGPSTPVYGWVVADGGWVKITNTGTTQAIPVQCVKSDGTGFESCAGGGGSSSSMWVNADGGFLDKVGVLNWVDGGMVYILNFPASQAVTGTFWQAVQPVNGAVQVDGGTVAILNFPASQAVTNAGLSNIDVALSTRTKPADQQHVIIDTIPSTAVTGPLTDTQLRATPVPVSGTVTATGTFWQATQPVSGSVQVDGGTVAILNFPATQAVTGTVTDQGQDTSGTSRTLSTDSRGVLYVQPLPSPSFSPSFNPLLPRCNAIRRISCQP